MGLRFPASRAQVAGALAWPVFLALAAVPFFVRSPRHTGPRRPGLLACAALAAGLIAGASLGSRTSARASASCVQDLATGDAVVVRGTTRESSRPGPSVRLTLFNATVSAMDANTKCPVGRLVVRVNRTSRSISAGTPVHLRGEWVRLGRSSSWPRRPGRVGIAVGKLAEPNGDTRQPGSSTAASITRILPAVRAQASERLRRLLPPDVSPVARALLLAERDDLPGAVRTRFAEAGLAHLLAISGLHVGMIGGAVVLLLGTFMGPARASVWSAAIVAVYVAAIGAPPSAVRASLLLAGWATARARGLPARPWDLLGGAALIALVADPLVLVEPGFQLSFAGFAGLGAGVSVWRSLRFRPVGRIAATVGRFRPLPRRVRRRLRLLGLAMAGGTGAFLATAPIAAVHFQHVAPAALVSHLAGAPLAGAAIGALAMALFLPPPLDALSADGAATVLRLMMALAGWISELPGAHFAARVPGRLTWMAILLSLAGLWRFLRWGRARSAVLPVAASVALILAAPVFTTRMSGGRSLICTLDVGQGDAAVLRTARGRWILFDAGPRFGSRDAGRDVVLPLLRRYGARRVDLFVLSHPDLDHVGGFDSVHEAVPVFRILDSGHPIPKPSYARFLARTEEDRIRWLPAGQGDVVYLDNVTIRVLGPPAASAEASGAARANETSLLLRVSIGRALVYLNTGDATMEDESALLAAWGPDSARADLLKVGHHGSRTATASDFVSAVSPAIAVISAGRGNAHGHPHEAVLGRLSGAAVPRVWRTDQEGTLCIEIDEEKGWRVQGETDWHSSRRVARVLTSQRSDE